MRRHKYLRRLERLRDAIVDKYGGAGWGDMRESDFTNDTVWLIWLSLVKDIKECGLSYSYRIEGLRLFYYNELWKKVNDKDYDLEGWTYENPNAFKLYNMTNDGTWPEGESKYYTLIDYPEAII